jgi:hypothetical protein
MTADDTNTHEAPLLDPESRLSSQEPFEQDDNDQNASDHGLPLHHAPKSKSGGWKLASLFKGWKVILLDSCKNHQFARPQVSIRTNLLPTGFNVLLIMIPIAASFDI